jgi:hypothetical protein
MIKHAESARADFAKERILKQLKEAIAFLWQQPLLMSSR